MQKFFVNSRDIEQNEIVLTGENARHISLSLRMAPGERICVGDGRGTDCLCEIVRITSDAVYAAVKERGPSAGDPPYRAVLYQALAKGDKMDYIVQKAVEFGVAEIVPFESSRCVARLREGQGEKKTARWRRIALEAAKQCGRGTVPEVRAPVSYAEALELAEKDGGVGFVCYENERDVSIASLKKAGGYSFFIGPEGGFSGEEIALAEKHGLKTVSLGPRILRCESASGFVLACLCFIAELL